MRLIVQGLSVRRGVRLVLDDLTLTVEAGEALVIEGRNGSGKTTLLRTIGGFLPTAAGSISIEGGDGPSLTIGEQCHYVGHLNALKGSLSVRDNLCFWIRYYGETRSQDVSQVADRALERFELEPLADIPTAYLSAGQKRRACLARLNVMERPIWLLDEPTVSLDGMATALLADVINEHTAKGGIVLAATHLPLGLDRTRGFHMEPVIGQVGAMSSGDSELPHDYDDWAAR